MLRRCYHCRQSLSWSDDEICSHCHRPLDRKILAAIGGIDRFARRIEEAERIQEIDSALGRDLRATCERRREALEEQGKKSALDVPLEVILEPIDEAPAAPAAPVAPAAPAAPQPTVEASPPARPPRPRPAPPPAAPAQFAAGLPPRAVSDRPVRTRPAAPVRAPKPPKPPLETPRWVLAVRSLLFENVLWFIAGFLIVSGAVYFAATTWKEFSDQTRYGIVVASVVSLGALMGGLGWVLARRFELAREGLVCFLIAHLVAPALFLVSGQGWTDLSDPALGILLAAIASMYLVALALMQGTAAPVSSWMGQAFPLAFLGLMTTTIQNLAFAGETAKHLIAIYVGFGVVWFAFLHPGDPGEARKGRPRGLLARWFVPSVYGAAYVALLANLYRLYPHGNPGLYSVAFVLAGALVVDRDGRLLFRPAEDAKPISPAAIAGLSVSVLGVVLAAASPGTLLAATAFATVLYALCARRYGKAYFVGMALATGMVAYFFSPVPIQAAAMRAKDAFAETVGYESKKLPLPFYGLTFFPYLAAVTWFARRFRIRDQAQFFRVAVGWIVLISIGLLVLVNATLPPHDFKPALYTLPLYGAGFLAAGVLLRLGWFHYLGSLSLSLATWYLARHFEWQPQGQAALLAATGLVWQAVSMGLGKGEAARAFAHTALALLAITTLWLGALAAGGQTIAWHGPAMVGVLAITNALSLRLPALTVVGLVALTASAYLAAAGTDWTWPDRGVFLVVWAWVLLGSAWALRIPRVRILDEVVAGPLLGYLACFLAFCGLVWLGVLGQEDSSKGMAAVQFAELALLAGLATPLWRVPGAIHAAGLTATLAWGVASVAAFPGEGTTFHALAMVPFAYALLGLVVLAGRAATSTRLLAGIAPYAAHLRYDAIALGVGVFGFLVACLGGEWLGIEQHAISWPSATIAFLALTPLFHGLSRARGRHPVSACLAVAAPILAVQAILLHLAVDKDLETWLGWQPFVLGAAALALAGLPRRPTIRLLGSNAIRGAVLLRHALVPVATSLTLLVWARTGLDNSPTFAGLGALALSTAFLLGIPWITSVSLAAFTIAAHLALVGFGKDVVVERHGTFLVAAAAVQLALAWGLPRALRRPSLRRLLAEPVVPILFAVAALAFAFWIGHTIWEKSTHTQALHLAAVALVLYLTPPLVRSGIPTHYATAAAATAWFVFLRTSAERLESEAGYFFYGLAFVGFAYAVGGIGRLLSRGLLLEMYRKPMRADAITIGIGLFWYSTLLTVLRPFHESLGSAAWSAYSFVSLLPLYLWLAWTHDDDPVRRVSRWLEVKAGYLALACPMMAVASVLVWQEVTVHAVGLLVAAWGLVVSYLPVRALVQAGGRNIVRAAPILRATLAPAALAVLIGIYLLSEKTGDIFWFDLTAALILVGQAARGTRHPKLGWPLAITFWTLLFASIYAYLLVHLLPIEPAVRAPSLALVALLAVVADRLLARREGWQEFARGLEATLPLVFLPLVAWLGFVWSDGWMNGTFGEHPSADLATAVLGAAAGAALARSPARRGAAIYLNAFLVAGLLAVQPVERLLELEAWKPGLPSIDFALLGAGVALYGLFRPDRGASRIHLYQTYPIALVAIALVATRLSLHTPATSATLFAASLVAMCLSLARREAWIGYVYGTLFLAGVYWLIFAIIPRSGRSPFLILPLLSVATLAVGAAVAALGRWLSQREGLARETAAVLATLSSYCIWLAYTMIAVGILTVRPPDAKDAETWNFVLTIASLVGLTGALVSRHLATGGARHVYAAGGMVLLGYAYLRWKVEVLDFLKGADGHVLVLLALVAYQISRLVDEKTRPGLVRPLVHFGLFLPIGALAFLAEHRLDAAGAGLLAFAAVHYGLVWLSTGQKRYAWVSGTFFNLLLYDLFLQGGLDARFWGLPLGASFMAFAQLHRKELPAATITGLRIAGFCVMYASVVLQIVMQNPDAGTLFFLAGLCVVGVLAGLALASRGLVLISAVTLVVDVVGHIAFSSEDLGFLGALAMVATGLALLGLALWTTLRKRRLSGESSQTEDQAR